MGQKVDAVIIGAGVIGTATAFELCKRGYKTLNIDKLPSAGYGPTSNSCAIVRAHYSSFDGVAMAYEGFFYWKKWAEYLEAPDESGLAKYMMAGTVLLESATGHHDKVLPHYDRLGVPYEVWDTATLEQKVPIFDVHEFWPPSRPEDDDFAAPRTKKLPGADLHARLRLRQRSRAVLAQPPARRRGARRRVPLPPQGDRDQPGQRQGDRASRSTTAPRSKPGSSSTWQARTRS